MAPKAPSPSLLRLLEAATRATAHLPPSRQISDLDALRADTGQTPQAWHAWKERGISKDGALVGEQRYGVPAVWLLDGSMPARWPGPPLSGVVTANEPAGAHLKPGPSAAIAIADVVAAIAALPPMRYASVRAVLDQVAQHPEMRDEAIVELCALLDVPGKQRRRA